LVVAAILISVLSPFPAQAQTGVTGNWRVECELWNAPRFYQLLEQANGTITVSAFNQPQTNLWSIDGTLLWNKAMTAAHGNTIIRLTNDPMAQRQGRLAPLEIFVVNPNELRGNHMFFLWDAEGNETKRFQKTTTWIRQP